MPLRISPEDAWWTFDGSGDLLDLPEGEADLFDPQSNNNNFTVAGVIAPDTITKAKHAPFSKWDEVNNRRSWLVQVENDDVSFYVSADGSTSSQAQVASALSIGVKSFFCGRYEYSTILSNTLTLEVDGVEDEDTAAVGPVFSGTTKAPARIAGLLSSLGADFEGDIYWLAYWNRKLTDLEVSGLSSGTKLPQLLEPDFYWDGHRAVAAEYPSDIPDGWSDPQLTFDVNGNPTKGGSALSSVEVIVGIGKDRPVMPSGEANEEVFGVGGLRGVQVHPRQSARDKGLGVVYLIQKRNMR